MRSQLELVAAMRTHGHRNCSLVRMRGAGGVECTTYVGPGMAGTRRPSQAGAEYGGRSGSRLRRCSSFRSREWISQYNRTRFYKEVQERGMQQPIRLRVLRCSRLRERSSTGVKPDRVGGSHRDQGDHVGRIGAAFASSLKLLRAVECTIEIRSDILMRVSRPSRMARRASPAGAACRGSPELLCTIGGCVRNQANEHELKR